MLQKHRTARFRRVKAFLLESCPEAKNLNVTTHRNRFYMNFDSVKAFDVDEHPRWALHEICNFLRESLDATIIERTFNYNGRPHIVFSLSDTDLLTDSDLVIGSTASHKRRIKAHLRAHFNLIPISWVHRKGSFFQFDLTPESGDFHVSGLIEIFQAITYLLRNDPFWTLHDLRHIPTTTHLKFYLGERLSDENL